MILADLGAFSWIREMNELPLILTKFACIAALAGGFAVLISVDRPLFKALGVLLILGAVAGAPRNHQDPPVSHSQIESSVPGRPV